MIPKHMLCCSKHWSGLQVSSVMARNTRFVNVLFHILDMYFINLLVYVILTRVAFYRRAAWYGWFMLDYVYAPLIRHVLSVCWRFIVLENGIENAVNVVYHVQFCISSADDRRDGYVAVGIWRAMCAWSLLRLVAKPCLYQLFIQTAYCLETLNEKTWTDGSVLISSRRNVSASVVGASVRLHTWDAVI